MTNKSLAALALTLVSACGGTEVPSGPAAGGCTISVSGAATGSVACTTPPGAYDSSANVWVFSLGGMIGSNQATLGLTFNGPPHTGSFSSSDSGAKGATSYGGGSAIWVASKSTDFADQGTFTVTLTTASSGASGGTASSYTLHGTADATMPALPGAASSGTVSLHLVF